MSRSNYRPKAELYPFGLQKPIPRFTLPLRGADTEPLIDLQALLHRVYDRAGFNLAIDYTCEPISPLAEFDAVWAAALLQQQGLR